MKKPVKIGLLVLAIIAIWVHKELNRTSKETFVDPQLPAQPTEPSAAQFAPLPPPTGSPANVPITAPSMAEAPTPERLESLRAEYLAKFPPAFREAIQVRSQLSAPGVWMFEVEMSGARLMASDARALRNADGSWTLWEFEAPRLPDRPRPFPNVSLGELERIIREDLDRARAKPETVEALEKVWLPDDANLTPCEIFQVDYTDAESAPKKEKWCLQPEQKRIVWKRQRTRG